MAKSLLAYAISILLVSFQATYAAPVSGDDLTISTRKSTSGYIGLDSSSATHKTGGEEYVVFFKPGSSRKRSLSVMSHIASVLTSLDLTPDNDDVTHIFNGTLFNGFSAKMKSHCIDALNAMEDIDVIEKVQTFRAHQLRPRQVQLIVQTDEQSTWGLQAISSSPQPITDITGFSHEYMFDANNTLGQGVDVYVLDTGINTAHQVFATADGGSRADLQSLASTQIDDEGHGTHVSGTIGGQSVGVAPAVSLHGIKILESDGSGSTSTILKGMETVLEAHAQRKSQPGFIGSVVNMSLGGTRSRALNSAAGSLTQGGVHVVVSAGNEADDACNYSPSGQGGVNGDVISVGSIGATYEVSSFSNTGRCVDVYAPGESIVSSWITSNRSLNILQGTSMSCPHVTGLVAYFMANDPRLGQDPAAMKATLKGKAQTGAIGNDADLLLASNGLQ